MDELQRVLHKIRKEPECLQRSIFLALETCLKQADNMREIVRPPLAQPAAPVSVADLLGDSISAEPRETRPAPSPAGE